MGNRDAVVAKEVEFLKEIQSLDDVKANVDRYIASIKTVVESAVDDARDFAAKVESMSDEEKKGRVTQFMDDDYMMPPNFVAEMERIDNIPGVIDYTETIDLDMDAMFDSLAEEFMGILNPYVQELMDGALGDMFGAIGDAFEEAFGDSED